MAAGMLGQRPKALNFDGLSIRRVVEIPREVELLSLRDNRLRHLQSIQDATSLVHVRLGGNRLKDKAIRCLAHLPNLRYLDISRNDLQTLALAFDCEHGAFAKLEELDLSSNTALQDVRPAFGAPRLRVLRAAALRVSELVCPTANSLEVLDLRKCCLSEVVHLQALPSLSELLLDGNAFLSADSVSSHPLLQKLRLGHNALLQLAPPRLPSLRALDLTQNQLTKAPSLTGAFQLAALALRGNMLTSLSALAGLRSLTFLDVSHNQLSCLEASLSESVWRSLQVLSISANNFSVMEEVCDALASAEEPQLQHLDLRDNPLSLAVYPFHEKLPDYSWEATQTWIDVEASGFPDVITREACLAYRMQLLRHCPHLVTLDGLRIKHDSQPLPCSSPSALLGEPETVLEVSPLAQTQDAVPAMASSGSSEDEALVGKCPNVTEAPKSSVDNGSDRLEESLQLHPQTVEDLVRAFEDSPAVLVMNLGSADVSQEGEQSCASQPASWDWRVVNPDGTTEPCALTPPHLIGESAKPACTDGERSCTSQAASWDWQVVTPLLEQSTPIPLQLLKHALPAEASPQTWISVGSATDGTPVAQAMTGRSPSVSSGTSPRAQSPSQPPAMPTKLPPSPVYRVAEAQDGRSTWPTLPWASASQRSSQPSAGASDSTLSTAQTARGSMVIAWGSRLSHLKDHLDSAFVSESPTEVVSSWRHTKTWSKGSYARSSKPQEGLQSQLDTVKRYGWSAKASREGKEVAEQGMEVLDSVVFACSSTSDANTGKAQGMPTKLWDSVDWHRPLGSGSAVVAESALLSPKWMESSASGGSALQNQNPPDWSFLSAWFPEECRCGACAEDKEAYHSHDCGSMLQGTADLRLPELRLELRQELPTQPVFASTGLAASERASTVEMAPQPSHALVPQEPLPRGTRSRCQSEEPLPRGTRSRCQSEVPASTESGGIHEGSRCSPASSPHKLERPNRRERCPPVKQHSRSESSMLGTPSRLRNVAAMLDVACAEVNRELHLPKHVAGTVIDDEVLLRSAALQKRFRQGASMQAKGHAGDANGIGILQRSSSEGQSRLQTATQPPNSDLQWLLDWPAPHEKSSPSRSHGKQQRRERRSGAAVTLGVHREVPASSQALPAEALYHAPETHVASLAACNSKPAERVDGLVKEQRLSESAQRLKSTERSARAALQDLLAKQAWMLSTRQLVYHYSLGRVMQPPGTCWSSGNKSMMPERMYGRHWVFFLAGDHEEKKLVRLLSSPRGFAEVCEGKVLLFALDLRYAECLGAKTGREPCEHGSLPSKKHGLLLMAEIALGRCVTAAQDLATTLAAGLRSRHGQLSGAVALDGAFAEARLAGAHSMYFPSLGVIAVLDPSQASPLYMCEYARYRTLATGRADAGSL